MKTKLVFTGIIMAFFLNACTVNELELRPNQIDLETIDIYEYKNSEIPKDSITVRTGGGDTPPKD